MSEALQNPQWVAAMQEKIDTLERNGTWELVPLPTRAERIGSKWAFNVKFQADRSIERYKARLVVKGFTQIPDKDCNATFAHVAKLTTFVFSSP